MYLTELSLKRPVFATVTIIALVALGMLSYFTLKINEYPEVEFPYVGVTVILPGASPEQVEAKVAHKVEDALGEVSGVKHIYTTARDSVALVFAEFTLETPASEAAQNVRDKISSIRGELPQDAEEPVIVKFDPMAVPIMSLAVTGDVSLRELTSIVDDTVKQGIQAVDGVGSINVYGAEEREIQINLDQEKLSAYGLATSEILGNLMSENMDIPAGKVSSDGKEISLRTSGSVNTIEGFYNLPVARREGVQLYVRDIASVVDGVKERDSMARYNEKPAIGLDIIKRSGTNEVEVADNIHQIIVGLKNQLPPGVKVEIVKDNSVWIRNSVNDVVRTIIEGGILAVLTVFIFLKNWRTTLISAISIPASIITTFFMMRLLNYTLNTMSLMALSLAVGLLIDDAIVVIENIERHMRKGASPLQAAKEATGEIGLAVMATTLTIVAVFFPVAMMTGIVGQFFQQFGITVICSVMVSLLISFTLVPLMASRYLKEEEEAPKGLLNKILAGFNHGFDRIIEKYQVLLSLVLRHRFMTMGMAVALFVGSLAIIPLLGSSFMSAGDGGEISVGLELDSGLSVDAAGKMTQQYEEIIKSYPEVEKMYSTIGTDNVSIYVDLVHKKDRERSDRDIAREWREKFNKIPGSKTSVITSTGMGPEKPVQLRLLGDNAENMQPMMEKALRMMESIPGVTDVSSNYKPGSPEEKIEIKQDVASDLGVSAAQIGTTLRTLFTGVVMGQFDDGDERYDVRVRLEEGQRSGIEDLNGIYLHSTHSDPDGGILPMIPLSQVTEKTYAPASSEVNRFDRQDEIMLSANLDGLSLGEFNKIFFEKVQELNLPEGYSIYASGESERMEDTFSSMGIALVTAILFIFFILAAEFESYIDPFSIMLSLPMAIIGAIGGLLVMGSDLSMMSMIGIIMLMGLVTKNAILLIDFTKQRRAKGIERSQALIEAGLTRLRPIVMTTMAMILGMMPVALGLGEGAEMRSSMAHAIIGGLITSTLLTLVVVPVIYTLLDDLKMKVSSLVTKKAPAKGSIVG